MVEESPVNLAEATEEEGERRGVSPPVRETTSTLTPRRSPFCLQPG
jgi:hypothetical protein